MTLPGVQDARLGRMAEFFPMAEARTAQLLLQAAHREGLLSDCRFSAEGGRLRWSRGEHALEVEGAVFIEGDRLCVNPASWTLSLEGFLEILRQLIHEPTTAAWDRLCDEALGGAPVLAAAYSVCAQKEAPEGYLDFEGWTPEGHNLHPGAKTRDGFSFAEQFEFAPEFAEVVSLPWLRVDRSLLIASGEVPEQFLSSDEGWMVPVHPWQLRHLVPKIYTREWEQGAIALADRQPLICRPCTSLRTLVPLDESYPVLKTSVGALMTSTERSMSRHTVLQGPIYNEYLLRAREQDPELFASVRLLEEHGGLCWHEDIADPRARNLSLLFRQRPPRTASGEVAVPCSALPQPVALGAANGRPRSYFAEFLGRGASLEESFQRYLDLLITFHLKLYLDWGIALEAHLQNCVVVWDERGPKELWVRDWGGLRADGEVIAAKAPDLFSHLIPSSVTLRDSETAEKKLIACLCCNHLTELVYHTVRFFDVPEAELWQKVGVTVRAALGRRSESSLGRRLLVDPWPVKCLLRMRLGGGGGGDLYHPRANPLKAGAVPAAAPGEP